LKSNVYSEVKTDTKTKTYDLDFSSNYDLENHEFNNISLKIKDPKEKDSYLFDDTEFIFKNKVVNIKDLKSFINNFTKDINTFSNLYSILRRDIIIQNLKTYYFDKEIHLKFDNN